MSYVLDSPRFLIISDSYTIRKFEIMATGPTRPDTSFTGATENDDADSICSCKFRETNSYLHARVCGTIAQGWRYYSLMSRDTKTIKKTTYCNFVASAIGDGVGSCRPATKCNYLILINDNGIKPSSLYGEMLT